MVNDIDASYKETQRYVDSDVVFNEPCKESEYFDSTQITRFYTLLSWGLLVRGAAFESMKVEGEKKEFLTSFVQQAEAKMMEKARKVEEIEYSLVPIKTLVSIQLESGLIVLDYIQNKK